MQIFRAINIILISVLVSISIVGYFWIANMQKSYHNLNVKITAMNKKVNEMEFPNLIKIQATNKTIIKYIKKGNDKAALQALKSEQLAIKGVLH